MFKRKTRGFTIVELLVVIGIILILAAFITPAVSRGRDRAIMAQCINNIRQAGMATLMFAQDNGNMTAAAEADIVPYSSNPAPRCPVQGAYTYTSVDLDNGTVETCVNEALNQHLAAANQSYFTDDGVARFDNAMP